MHRVALSIALVLACVCSSQAAPVGIGPTVIDGVQYDFQASVLLSSAEVPHPISAFDIDGQGNVYVSYMAVNGIQHFLRKFAAGPDGSPSKTTVSWTTTTHPTYLRPRAVHFAPGILNGTLFAGFGWSNAGKIPFVNTQFGSLSGDIIPSMIGPADIRNEVTALGSDPISKDLYYTARSRNIFRVTGLNSGTPYRTYVYTFPDGYQCGPFDAPTSLNFDAAGNLYYTYCGRLFRAPYQPANQVSISSLLLDKPLDFTGGSASTLDGKLLVASQGQFLTAVSSVTGQRTQIVNDPAGYTSDQVSIGPDGCYYYRVYDGIYKLTNLPNGKCNFGGPFTFGQATSNNPSGSCSANSEKFTVSASCAQVSRTTTGKALSLLFSSSVSNCN